MGRKETLAGWTRGSQEPDGALVLKESRVLVALLPGTGAHPMCEMEHREGAIPQVCFFIAVVNANKNQFGRGKGLFLA